MQYRDKKELTWPSWSSVIQYHTISFYTMTMNDNENTLFDHNIQIEITIYKQFK